MRRFASLLLALLLVLTWAPAGSIAAEPLPDGAVRTAGGRVLPELPAELQEPSVHAEMLADHAGDALDFELGGPPSVVLSESGEPEMAGAAVEPTGTVAAQVATAGLPNGLRKEVFGFLPYWLLTDTALAELNYHLLSTIAYFSVGTNKDGYLVKGTSTNPSTGWAGWTSSRMTQVIDRAHSNGVKVVLTVTMMAWDSASASRQAALLGSGTARTRLVNQIVSAVRARGADGVNLDFEPLASSLRDEYVSFVRQLKKGLVDGNVGSHLTVCVMAGAATWATGYDVAGLTASGAADALFVMGYDFHWSGSSRAGGVAPIQSPYTIDVAGTMADFLTETSGSKLIWGVPYYGRTWPTSSRQLNSTTLGGGSRAYSYIGARSQAGQYGRRWDDVGKVPWYRHWDSGAGNWVQGYYDDPQSLGVKYDLINARGLAGTGMWTLLMDQGRDELWRLLADKFVRDTQAPVGGVDLLPGTTDAEAFVVRWRAQDYASGVSHYNLQYRLVGGAWHAWLSGTRKTSAWFAGTVGARYEFRVRAYDLSGNAQAWTTMPAKPSSVKPGAFAVVTAASLNVRSGPGTGYAIVDTAVDGQPLFVLEGPVTSGSQTWYRVQYGFTEWPSADYALIAWVAGSDSGTSYLAPRWAPTTTRIAPFVRQTTRTASFSPNGDGVKDGASLSYTLQGGATAVQLDVFDDKGSVVRTVALGAQSAGANSASWNGRTSSGAWAGEGRYLLRITATDAAGASHFGPAAGFSPTALNRWGIGADLTGPTASGSPRRGAQMVPAKQQLQVLFSEPISGLAASRVQLRVAGVPVPATFQAAGDAKSAIVDPDAPLPVDTTIDVWLSTDLRDVAGNRLATEGWKFRVAPGTAYDPSRSGLMTGGSHRGYAVGAHGDLLASEFASLGTSKGVAVGQRATLPNLPGRWLLLETGPLRGRWVRESVNDYVKGLVERHTYASDIALRLRPATHVGYRFGAGGAAISSRSLTVSRRTSVGADARAIINGRAYWRIIEGMLTGYWVPESLVAFKPGAIERLDFDSAPRIDLAVGTHTGYRFDKAGNVTGTVVATQGVTRSMTVSAWAVINGRGHFLVSSGAWSGTWLPESAATRLRV
ncbi:MAG TPA: glycosyl hydrolase family 18 protein [Candidatus Limnocylindria bacterium]|nr:glycosyl hydrolase family 18 protein [Candidatus Limnocylindria bacterium]